MTFQHEDRPRRRVTRRQASVLDAARRHGWRIVSAERDGSTGALTVTVTVPRRLLIEPSGEVARLDAVTPARRSP